jgi:predicted transcriptional regulator
MQRSLSTIEYSGEEASLAMVAKALSHPVRLKILKLLAGETCCFTGELTEIIPMAQSTISQHLKALLEAGLIQGEINPPKVKYCINQANWKQAQSLFHEFFGRETISDCKC